MMTTSTQNQIPPLDIHTRRKVDMWRLDIFLRGFFVLLDILMLDRCQNIQSGRRKFRKKGNFGQISLHILCM